MIKKLPKWKIRRKKQKEKRLEEMWSVFDSLVSVKSKVHLHLEEKTQRRTKTSLSETNLHFITVCNLQQQLAKHLTSSSSYFPDSCLKLPSIFSQFHIFKMPINKDPSTPPPVIGKIGPYTVFMTPPATPKPPESPSAVSQKPVMPPPVLPPPQQFKSVASSEQDGSVLGFFKNAVTKVQNGK